MGHPEKDPENTPESKKDPPKLDAIFPDDLPPAAAELVGDIDNYQKRMEKEWESAKSSYEKKINHIMEEFMMAGLAGMTSETEEKPVKKPAPEPPAEPTMETPRKKPRISDERLKNLM